MRLLRNGGRHNDAAMCDAHHVDAQLVDNSTVLTKACRVLWDALKNAHSPTMAGEGLPQLQVQNGNIDCIVQGDALPSTAAAAFICSK